MTLICPNVVKILMTILSLKFMWGRVGVVYLTYSLLMFFLVSISHAFTIFAFVIGASFVMYCTITMYASRMSFREIILRYCVDCASKGARIMVFILFTCLLLAVITGVFVLFLFQPESKDVAVESVSTSPLVLSAVFFALMCCIASIYVSWAFHFIFFSSLNDKIDSREKAMGNTRLILEAMDERLALKYCCLTMYLFSFAINFVFTVEVCMVISSIISTLVLSAVFIDYIGLEAKQSESSECDFDVLLREQ